MINKPREAVKQQVEYHEEIKSTYYSSIEKKINDVLSKHSEIEYAFTFPLRDFTDIGEVWEFGLKDTVRKNIEDAGWELIRLELQEVTHENVPPSLHIVFRMNERTAEEMEDYRENIISEHLKKLSLQRQHRSH